MKKRPFIPRLYPYILLLCITSPLASAEFSKFIIDDITVENIKRSHWVKKSSGIVVVDLDNRQFSIFIETDSGRVHLDQNRNAPLEVFVNNEPCDSMRIRFPRKIRRFRLGAKFDKKANRNYIQLKLMLGKKLDLKPYDLFIFPFLVKLIILPFQKNAKLKIFIRDTRNASRITNLSGI